MKKGTFKYYLSTYIMSYVFVLLLTIVSHAKGSYFIGTSVNPTGKLSREITCFLYQGKTFIYGKYLVDEIGLIVVPLIFTLLFFLIDLLSKLLKGKKKRNEEANEEKYNNFVDEIGSTLNKTKLFNPEDFRHFRENTKFQECLKRLYKIYSEGETEQVNYYLVLRKFDKGTTERKAIEYLVTYTERKRKEKEALKESENNNK